jgi:hypothetical protein
VTGVEASATCEPSASASGCRPLAAAAFGRLGHERCRLAPAQRASTCKGLNIFSAAAPLGCAQSAPGLQGQHKYIGTSERTCVHPS